MTNKTSENEVQAPTEGLVQDSKKPETPKFKKEELLAIFDEMIFEGQYVEDVALRGGKLKVRFKSRSVDDTTAISRDIDGKNFSLITTLQEHRAVLNLAYSLVSYAGQDLAARSAEDRIKFIGKLPGVIVGALSEALNRFDEKINAACVEGEANF
jgi:hypothetical protein